MNFKYLSKYHYIYRLSFGNDKEAHVEKLPIAYANKHHVYVIEPGNDDLRKLNLLPYDLYSTGDIYLEVNETVKNVISAYMHRLDDPRYVSCKNFWFLLEDPKPLNELAKSISSNELAKVYWLYEKKKAEKEVESARSLLAQRCNNLASILGKLEQIEKPEAE